MSDDAPTATPQYADRLHRLETAAWKRLLDVQAPYRWNVRRLCEGRVLEVGCGIGRNLAHLAGRAIGVDHNSTSVAIARSRGLEAYTPDEFRAERHRDARPFDTLLAAHLLEHLEQREADAVLSSYLRHVRPGGRVVLITPQEAGWKTDDSHVRWVAADELARTCRRLGLRSVNSSSFPFPRPFGKVFPYNEFVHVAITPAATG